LIRRWAVPTAVHTVAEVQETALSAPIPALGFGLGLTLQRVPFELTGETSFLSVRVGARVTA
jgi:hypothetical protein